MKYSNKGENIKKVQQGISLTKGKLIFDALEKKKKIWTPKKVFLNLIL